jgi:hypothetical protein
MHAHAFDRVVLLCLHTAFRIQSPSTLHDLRRPVKTMKIDYEPKKKFERINFVLGKSSELNIIYLTSVDFYFPNVFIKFRTPHRIIFEFIAFRNIDKSTLSHRMYTYEN